MVQAPCYGNESGIEGVDTHSFQQAQYGPATCQEEQGILAQMDDGSGCWIQG